MEMPLPKYAAFKHGSTGKYLEYLHAGSLAGSLKYSGENIATVYTKFEIEPTESGGHNVHIRCCYNNKYWASSNDSTRMVTPFVDEPHDDPNSWPCTLFEIWETAEKGAYKLYDVRLKTYVAVCITSDIHEHCLTTRYGKHDEVFKFHTLVDFGSILVLPKRVAFKGDNGKYLGFVGYNSLPYLEFFSDDIGDPKISNQVFTMSDGSVRIKSDAAGRFWRRDPNWIKPDSGDTTGNNKNTLFWPTKVSKNVVALRNLGNNRYCKRLSADDKSNCLNAAIETITKEAHMEIEEPVISREIYNVIFRPLDGKIRDQKVITKASNDTSNGGTEPTNTEMQFKYTDTRSKTWDSSLTISLGITTSIQAGIPLIAEGKIEIHESFTGSYTWGETLTESKEVTATYNVDVPPGTRLKVSLVATIGTCDIPFSYTQRDILRTGEQVITMCDDGVYVGVNSYNFKYESESTPM